MSKLVAAAGVASRRKAADLIRAGRVQVDGRRVVDPGAQVDPKRVRVQVDGRAVRVEPPVYILLNKPRGPLSAALDARGRQTVLDLVGEVGARLYPAGRLDADTEGLLLISNDGHLTYRLTHPRFEVEKVYEAEVKGRPSPAALQQLSQGVMLHDGPSGPARVRLVAAGEDTSMVELTIHAGRKRQVRRMLGAVGHPVVALRRTRLGLLRLGGLRPGEWRLLGAEEVSALQRYTDRRAARADRAASGKPAKRSGVNSRELPCRLSGTSRRRGA